MSAHSSVELGRRDRAETSAGEYFAPSRKVRAGGVSGVDESGVVSPYRTVGGQVWNGDPDDSGGAGITNKMGVSDPLY